VQDVEIPLERTADFVGWFLREIPVRPVWLCPLRLRGDETWPLYPLQPGEDYVNVGFWSTVPILPGAADGDVNRRVETVVAEHGGHKSLYSDAYYDEDRFWQLYGGDEYAKAKQTYDPDGRLADLYAKAVTRR
jgi:FAD/FMN-containing dehydrogenase